MTSLDPRIAARLRRWSGLHAVGHGRVEIAVPPGWHGLRAVFETPDETSWVGPWIPSSAERGVDEDLLGPLRAWSLPGPLPSDAVGVLAEVLEPLRRAGVSILAYSTHATDWVLVGATHADAAEAAWSAAGWTIEDADAGRPRTR